VIFLRVNIARRRVNGAADGKTPGTDKAAQRGGASGFGGRLLTLKGS
jgi:hypothetical protein